MQAILRLLPDPIFNVGCGWIRWMDTLYLLTEGSHQPNARSDIEWFLGHRNEYSLEAGSAQPNNWSNWGLVGLGGKIHNIHCEKGMVSQISGIIFIPVHLIRPIHRWILYLVFGVPFPSLSKYYVSVHLIHPIPHSILDWGLGWALPASIEYSLLSANRTSPSLNIIPCVRLTIPFPHWILCIHPPNPSNHTLNIGLGFRLSIACIHWLFIAICLIKQIHHWILYLVLGLPFPSISKYYEFVHLIHPTLHSILNLGLGWLLPTSIEYLLPSA